ncbi:CD0519/CD1768 family membrane protein [Endozoicomonas arenosclerae]|uniref:CD0519/CD1768 family membrane protein n=1 Tax=Endozoicomonas arenosclerae TaxID=1633495 RepID=UPI000ACE6B05|nr:nucleoside recognition domain-containing protein [Endozoicomonas arenosclerae]
MTEIAPVTVKPPSQRACKYRQTIEPLLLLAFLGITFGYTAGEMGVTNMFNTLFNTAHQLLLNTVLLLMGITVLAGALSKLLTEFHVIALIERLLMPLMRPVFNLPGRAAMAAMMTFFSDNPAIVSLARDRRFSANFKPHELLSLTNFGTAFGMGLIVITFMATLESGTDQNFFRAALIGLAGALVGAVISTRLMQKFTRNQIDHHPVDYLAVSATEHPADHEHKGAWLRTLNALLDGGKNGVEMGMAIIPGVLIISTLVMILTFGAPESGYSGGAFEGVALLPHLASYLEWPFRVLFGFEHPELIAFPITSLGAVGAAMSLVPNFISQGLVSESDIAVFTAMGMCWSGFLSTHTAMLDTLGYRKLTSKAILAHSIGGICAGIAARYLYLFAVYFF